MVFFPEIFGFFAFQILAKELRPWCFVFFFRSCFLYYFLAFVHWFLFFLFVICSCAWWHIAFFCRFFSILFIFLIHLAVD